MLCALLDVELKAKKTQFSYTRPLGRGRQGQKLQNVFADLRTVTLVDSTANINFILETFTREGQPNL